jgi:hypothetical protein
LAISGIAACVIVVRARNVYLRLPFAKRAIASRRWKWVSLLGQEVEEIEQHAEARPLKQRATPFFLKQLTLEAFGLPILFYYAGVNGTKTASFRWYKRSTAPLSQLEGVHGSLTYKSALQRSKWGSLDPVQGRGSEARSISPT